MINKIHYYFWATYRRKLLDNLLNSCQDIFKGKVLDFGCSDCGRFNKPKGKVRQWLVADICPQNCPDIVLDIAKMSPIKDSSIDVILANEVFEHVACPQEALQECRRVLKMRGTLLISVPFLYPVHAAPDDYQRWTEQKWRSQLEENGFKIVSLQVMGGFFTVLADMLLLYIKSLPKIIRLVLYGLHPLLDLIALMDKFTDTTKKGFHGGYFILATKK